MDYNQEIRTEVDLNDDGVYKLTCSNGHVKTYFVENDKYQILFDLGILAIDNSFYREAVSSFAASLERFYEYCIKVMLISEGIDISAINKTWKAVSNASERQIGAFHFLFLSRFNDVPLPFDNEMTRFRNSVIHKGYIPKKEEVLSYVDKVHSYIVSYLLIFKEHLQPSMDEYVFTRKSELVKKHNKSNLVSCKFGTTIDDDYVETKFDLKKSAHFLTDSFYPIYIK